jgi:hypothetical protein
MEPGTVRVATSTLGGLCEFFTGFQGGGPSPRSLYFTPTGDSKYLVLFTEGVARAGYRCLKCKALVLLDAPPEALPPPRRWVVRIAEQQQTKAPRRALYDSLRKHRIPHALASQHAGEFCVGLQVNIQLKEQQRAQTVLDEVRSLDLVAEVIGPASERQEAPDPSADKR